MGQPHVPLVRQIGLGTAIAVVVGSTIGSGIFRSPAGIAEKLPGPLPMFLCWAFAGLIVLCGALTLAEVGGAHPETGGLYAFIRDAYGRMAGFLFGWAQLVIIRPASLAAVAMAFSEYFLRVLGYPFEAGSWRSALIGAAAIVVVSTINYLGVVFGGAMQNLTTVLKVTGLLVVIAFAFGVGLPETGGHYTPLAPEGSFTTSMFALALISVLWAYDGWADGSYVAGEITEPRRNVPRALVWGTLIIIAVYMLANAAYLAVLSVGEIADSQLVAADVANKVMGRWGEVFISVTVMVSTFGTLNGSMITAPRIFYALAEDKLFFEPVARVNERFGTPGVATWLACAIGVTFILATRSFKDLADIFVMGMIPFYALAVSGIFALRKQKDYDPPVRTPLYPLPPVLFVVGMLFIFGNALVDPAQRVPTLWVSAGILSGVPIYWALFGRYRGT